MVDRSVKSDLSQNQNNGNSAFKESSHFYPDHRRFAIALSTDLPALTFYNPLLNHPSPSEYVASVRSSLCSSAVSSSTNSTPYSKAKTRSIYATESSAAFLTQDNWNRIVLPQHNDPATINEETKRRTSSVQSDVIKSALYKDSLCRKSIVSALIAGLVFLAAAIFLIVFFLVVGKGRYPSSLPFVQTVYGEFQLVNYTEIEDNNSTDVSFHELAIQLQHKLDGMFQNSTYLSKLYNRSEVIGIVTTTSGPLQNSVLRIQLKIYLNSPDVMIAEKMAFTFLSNLQPREEYKLLGNFTVNLTSIKFAETITPNVFTSISPEHGLASWGTWTEWTPDCSSPCNQSRTQSRSRRCLLREAKPFLLDMSIHRPLDNIAPCLTGSTVSAADVELRQCHCKPPRPLVPFTVFRPSKSPSSSIRFDNNSMITLGKACSQCRPGEVCVARLEEVVPVCRWPPDPEDTTGCGGFCRANTEMCSQFGYNSFRCEEYDQ